MLILSSHVISVMSRHPLALDRGPTYAQLQHMRSHQPQLEVKNSYGEQDYDSDYHYDVSANHLESHNHYSHQAESEPALPSWVLPLIALVRQTLQVHIPSNKHLPGLHCAPLLPDLHHDSCQEKEKRRRAEPVKSSFQNRKTSDIF